MTGSKHLGVDYGRKYIGLAVSDPDGLVSVPKQHFVSSGLEQDVETIAEIVRSDNIGTIVIGLPLNMDGSRGFMANEVDTFAKMLRRSCDSDVRLWDERLSSHEAEELVRPQRNRRGSKQKARPRIDSLAASIVLQAYLDSKRV